LLTEKKVEDRQKSFRWMSSPVRRHLIAEIVWLLPDSFAPTTVVMSRSIGMRTKG
jgi:hypothetical protein